MSEEKADAQPKIRLGWMSDAKWVVGIVAFFVVAATALVMVTAKLTERETAITIITTVTATMFSPQGLDDPGDIEKLRAGLKAQPGKTIEPFPGVSVTAADIEGQSPREIRLSLFRRLAEPIYDRGTLATSKNPTSEVGFSGAGETRSALTSEVKNSATSEVSPERVKEASPAATSDQIGLLALLSSESHQKILGIQKILLGVSVVLLLLLILFSTGFGRLASPGWVLVLVAAVPTALTFLIEMSLKTHPPAPPTGEPNIATVAASAAADVAPMVLAAFTNVYRPLLLTGAGLVIVATLGGLIYHLVRHRKEAAA